MVKNNNISVLGKDYKNQVGEYALRNNNVTCKDIVVDLSNKFDSINLCFFSDTHLGSSDADIKGILQNLDYIDKSDDSFAFVMGDIANMAIVGSKSDQYEDILSPQEQLDDYITFLKAANGNKTVADKFLGLQKQGKVIVAHLGNHEERIKRSVGLNVVKIAAESAGLGNAYASFYANTDIVLRQPESPDGKFHFRIVSHHGTGIKNIDGLFRLLKNVSNADMCVIGHTHQTSMKVERTIKENEKGEQEYHDVTMLTLPSCGGGTYGAGMALPDVYKEPATWFQLSSIKSPYAGKVSPTGVKYPEFVPGIAFYNPTTYPNTKIKIKRISQAENVVQKYMEEHQDEINEKVYELLDYLKGVDKEVRNEICEKIKEKPRKEPKEFMAYLEKKHSEGKEEKIKNKEKENIIIENKLEVKEDKHDDGQLSLFDNLQEMEM